jgi:hypothetical protein
MSIYLEDEQLALFEQLLEAWRAMPRDQRVPFLYVRTMGANIVQGNGLNLQVADGDIEALRAEGLLSFDGDSFTISARSVASYREWEESHVEPAADIEDTMQRYLDSDQFRARYPGLCPLEGGSRTAVGRGLGAGAVDHRAQVPRGDAGVRHGAARTPRGAGREP